MGLLLQPHIVVASMRKRYVKLASCDHIKFLATFLEPHFREAVGDSRPCVGVELTLSNVP